MNAAANFDRLPRRWPGRNLTTRLLSLLVLICCLSLNFAVASQYRVWRTRAGKKAKARIVSVDGTTLTLQGENGSEFKVAIDLLAVGDIRHLDNLRQSGDVRHSVQIVGAGNGSPDRILVPTYNQSDFAKGQKSCGPNAFGNFVLWWDRIGVYQIPEGDTELEKAEWLHRVLRKHFSARNGTSNAEMIKGIRSFFREYPSRNYTFKIKVTHPVTIENLERATQGISATILNVSTAERGKINRKKGHWASLLQVSRRGAFLLNTWGKVFRGQLLVRKTTPPVEPGGPERQVVALELTPDASSEYFRKAKEQWLIDPSMGDCLLVVVPEPR